MKIPISFQLMLVIGSKVCSNVTKENIVVCTVVDSKFIKVQFSSIIPKESSIKFITKNIELCVVSVSIKYKMYIVKGGYYYIEGGNFCIKK